MLLKFARIRSTCLPPIYGAPAGTHLLGLVALFRVEMAMRTTSDTSSMQASKSDCMVSRVDFVVAMRSSKADRIFCRTTGVFEAVDLHLLRNGRIRLGKVRRRSRLLEFVKFLASLVAQLLQRRALQTIGSAQSRDLRGGRLLQDNRVCGFKGQPVSAWISATI